MSKSKIAFLTDLHCPMCAPLNQSLLSVVLKQSFIVMKCHVCEQPWPPVEIDWSTIKQGEFDKTIGDVYDCVKRYFMESSLSYPREGEPMYERIQNNKEIYNRWFK